MIDRWYINNFISNVIIHNIRHHCRDCLERDMADPPDLIDDFSEKTVISEGALEGRSMLFYFRKSSMRGPRSGRSSPRFLNKIICT